MSKILVGRDNRKEVNIGAPFQAVAQVGTGNAEAKEELAEEAVENKQVVVAEEGNVPEAEAAPVKGRGKKRGKA